jgi:aspartate-semialdehyde dehydrogenase
MSVSVAILGATGVVGQKAIALLARNPWIKIIELVASDRRIGQTFGEVCDWREVLMPMPDSVSSIVLKGAKNLLAEIIISCLPSEIARTVEPMLAAQGKIVFSNASTFRMQTSIYHQTNSAMHFVTQHSKILVRIRVQS